MKRTLRTTYPAIVFAIACGVHGGAAFASLSTGKGTGGYRAAAATEYSRFVRMTSSAREIVLASKSGELQKRARQIARSSAPVVAVTQTGVGQTGYVHYFLLRFPDDTREVQIGIEMPDQRIAWSFPGLGVVVSPFVEAGIVSAGGADYEVYHLYGVRPFPDDMAMAALQKQLSDRVHNLTERNIAYCEDDGPQSRCMSCLGFVMRVLFPGRDDDYPAVPRDYSRAVSAARYTTHDLLLYLTGLLELPTRPARLQRLKALAVPPQLREDLETLVRMLTPAEPPAAAKTGKARETAQKRAGSRKL